MTDEEFIKQTWRISKQINGTTCTFVAKCLGAMLMKAETRTVGFQYSWYWTNRIIRGLMIYGFKTVEIKSKGAPKGLAPKYSDNK